MVGPRNIKKTNPYSVFFDGTPLYLVFKGNQKEPTKGGGSDLKKNKPIIGLRAAPPVSGRPQVTTLPPQMAAKAPPVDCRLWTLSLGERFK